MRPEIESRLDEVIVLPELAEPIRPVMEPRALLAMARSLRKLRPHILHTHNTKDGIYARLTYKLARVPISVRTYHGNFWQEWFSPAHNYFALAIELALVPLTDLFIAVTKRDRDKLISLGVAKPENIEVIYSGIDTEKFNLSARAFERNELLPGIDPETPLIGMVADFRTPKDHSTLLKAIRILADEGVAFHLLLVGSGEGEEKTRREVENLRISDRVTFLGHQSQVERFYRSIDLCVLSSHYEGLSRTIVEAVACGCPVVASDVGAHYEVLTDGESGWLVPSRNARILSERIGWCLTHKNETRMMARIALERLPADFDGRRMAQKIQACYERLLSDKGIYD